MGVDGARQIGLLIDAQRIFQRQQHQRRAGVAEEAYGGIDHLIGLVGFLAKVLRVLAQRVAQAFALTLAGGTQTFRTTRAGALAYFAGGDANFPDDSGFALKPWRGVRIQNIGLQIRHDTAMVMSRAVLTDADGRVTEVDKTWGYRRGPEGVRIVLHHSSLARVE